MSEWVLGMNDSAGQMRRRWHAIAALPEKEAQRLLRIVAALDPAAFARAAAEYVDVYTGVMELRPFVAALQGLVDGDLGGGEGGVQGAPADDPGGAAGDR